MNSAQRGRKASVGSIEGRKLKKAIKKRKWGSISSIPEKKIEITVKEEDQAEQAEEKEEKADQ